MLDLKNLKASIEGKEILKGIDLVVKSGEIHVLMGPNGSGKSTLAQVIMGHPSYIVNYGQLTMDGKSLAGVTPDKRAKLGIFLAFQHPVEIPGVSMIGMLRKAKQVISDKSKVKSGKNPASKVRNLESVKEFRQELLRHSESLKLGESFLSRSINEGFSGGEKKRSEILQMMALNPKLVILDEIDSGLDVDGLKIVAQAVKKFTVENPHSSILLITHYARILKYLKPDFVHIMMDGKIIKSGKASLAQKIEKEGYQGARNDLEQRPIKDAHRAKVGGIKSI